MKPASPFPASWYQRPALDVAPALMGQKLCRQIPDGQVIRKRISEVEAYIGAEDTACHAHRGKTVRNAIMYDPGGNWYVYLCYGIHWLLNITTGPADNPEAVLIRGVEGISGPGRLTKALNIGRAEKNRPASLETGLWIEPGDPFSPEEILRTPRIGIDYAEGWKDKPFRWVLADSNPH
jgi:DNA-3-methyladenine glycosylase